MFTIDNMSSVPVYEQLVRQIEGKVLAGEMKPGDPMPSVRELADQLNVNHNTIQKAYTELERRGLTASVPGRGRFLKEDAMKNLVAYLNANVRPEFKNMLKGMLIAGATKKEVLEYVGKLLDEIENE